MTKEAEGELGGGECEINKILFLLCYHPLHHSEKAITEVSALISPLNCIHISLLFTVASFCCDVTEVDDVAFCFTLLPSYNPSLNIYKSIFLLIATENEQEITL